jgi:hypothetical protein
MSADNGIYILETLSNAYGKDGKEYRVANLQSYGIINFDERNELIDVQIQEARKMWIKENGCLMVIGSRTSALICADIMAQEVLKNGPLEYGIQFIKIDRHF